MTEFVGTREGTALNTEDARELILKASTIALFAHAGQVDKQGESYVQHLRRVAEQFPNDPYAAATGWLHDILEDTDATALGLILAGIPMAVIVAVEHLTKVPGQSYQEYIDRLVACAPDMALRVKAADLRDNLRPGWAIAAPKYRAALTQIERVLGYAEPV